MRVREPGVYQLKWTLFHVDGGYYTRRDVSSVPAQTITVTAEPLAQPRFVVSVETTRLEAALAELK